jgi:hypothetical protein
MWEPHAKAYSSMKVYNFFLFLHQIHSKAWIKVWTEALFRFFFQNLRNDLWIFCLCWNSELKIFKTYLIWETFKIQKKSWEFKNSATNSLQNRAIKKVIREMSIIATLNLTFNFSPRKTNFSLKKLAHYTRKCLKFINIVFKKILHRVKLKMEFQW